MTTISNPSLKNTVRDHFAEIGDDAPTWTELHGVLCALAVAPDNDTLDYGELLDCPVPAEIHDKLEQLRSRLVSQLVSGETISLPCLLDPYQEDDGQDLASWCAGFMAGVFADHEAWYEVDEQQAVELLLPFILISGLDDDPELDALWENTQVVRQMALSIPELLEEFYLMYHGREE